jgi:N-ethylmaleimide reductase
MNQSFTPVRVGRYTLPNRLVMAPMTRSRAKVDGTTGEMAAKYYSQRASVTLTSQKALRPRKTDGATLQPGIYTPAHVAGRKKVTPAVHDEGGRIFIQIMHAGRLPHPDNTPHHR